ncbi:MAG: radical SAM family heme chaperone HemW [Pseudomonadota bacterium]
MKFQNVGNSLNPQKIPSSLYIHIPWCVRKCPYCDFNSHQIPENIPEFEYINALIQDLYFQRHWIQERSLHSIFIGGGTPSLFSAEAIGKLLHSINSLWQIENSTEITLEANPGTTDEKHFSAYRSCGINRISIGVQSFDDKQLEKLGRIHSSRAALSAIETAQRSGCRVNLDLMFGLPQQSIEEGLIDLDIGLKTGVDHLSWYQLTIEPNTQFYRHPPKLPDDENTEELWELGRHKLAEHNFIGYEISAYAREGQECRHNLNYWSFGDYIGIGAGAHGKISTSQGIIRTQRTRVPQHYLDEMRADSEKIIIHREPKIQTISKAEQPFEFMMNTCRLAKGVSASILCERTALTLDQLEPHLTTAINKGWMEADRSRLQPSSTGFRMMNDLVSLWL